MSRDALPPLPSSTENESRSRMLAAISARAQLMSELRKNLAGEIDPPLTDAKRQELRERICRLDLEAEHHLAVIAKVKHA
jgi:hypothetical protein